MKQLRRTAPETAWQRLHDGQNSCCVHTSTYITRTHARWLKDMRSVSTRVHLKKSVGHLVFHGTLLEPQFSSASLSSVFLSTLFPTSTPNPMSTTSLLNSSTGSNPCATPQGGLLFGRLAEQSPLTFSVSPNKDGLQQFGEGCEVSVRWRF